MNIGVVGLGYWGSKVFEEYRALRNDNVVDDVSAIDTDERALSEVVGADYEFESLEEALGTVDAFHVATSNASHFPVAKTCLENGADVLLEKPLTTDRDRAFDLVQLASEQGRILQTGHIFRFATVVREIRDYYRRGFFGEIQHITLRWTHDFKPTGGDDVMWDLLPHPVDIINFVTDEWPTHFQGIANFDTTGDHRTAVYITFNVGHVTGVIHVSWLDKRRRRTLEIAGTKRSATVECVNQTITVTDGTDEEVIDITANNTIRDEAKNFITACETRKNTYNSAIVGARTVDTIERMSEAIGRE